MPTGDLAPTTAIAVNRLVASAGTSLDFDALAEVAASGDARLAWVVADLLRFLQIGRERDELVGAFEVLTGVDLAADPTISESPWRAVTDHLIAWDLPAPPVYQDVKSRLFLLVEPRWSPFFDDQDAAIDWRWVRWGGVLIDDRPLGHGGFCDRGCTPALDDPALTPMLSAGTGTRTGTSSSVWSSTVRRLSSVRHQRALFAICQEAFVREKTQAVPGFSGGSGGGI
ncbi:MAG: hypothetical protein ACR2ME_00380 [Acidimicrobiia bacterium]